MIKKEKFYPIYDALIAVSLLYVLACIYIGLFFTYYLSPLYITFLIPLAFFTPKYFKFKLFKYSLICCSAIFVFGIFLGLWYFSNYKQMANSMHNSMGVIANYIHENTEEKCDNKINYMWGADLSTCQHNELINKDNKRINIYLDGIIRDFSASDSLDAFLKEALINEFNVYNFDIKSYEETNLNKPINIHSEFNFYNSLDVSTPMSGDLIILTPVSTNYINADYLNNLNNKYELMYKSPFLIPIPRMDLKTIIKYFYVKWSGKLDKKYKLSGNFFGAPYGVYIFKVR